MKKNTGLTRLFNQGKRYMIQALHKPSMYKIKQIKCSMVNKRFFYEIFIARGH